MEIDSPRYCPTSDPLEIELEPPPGINLYGNSCMDTGDDSDSSFSSRGESQIQISGNHRKRRHEEITCSPPLPEPATAASTSAATACPFIRPLKLKVPERYRQRRLQEIAQEAAVSSEQSPPSPPAPSSPTAPSTTPRPFVRPLKLMVPERYRQRMLQEEAARASPSSSTLSPPSSTLPLSYELGPSPSPSSEPSPPSPPSEPSPSPSSTQEAARAAASSEPSLPSPPSELSLPSSTLVSEVVDSNGPHTRYLDIELEALQATMGVLQTKYDHLLALRDGLVFKSKN